MLQPSMLNYFEYLNTGGGATQSDFNDSLSLRRAIFFICQCTPSFLTSGMTINSSMLSSSPLEGVKGKACSIKDHFIWVSTFATSLSSSDVRKPRGTYDHLKEIKLIECRAMSREHGNIYI